MVQTEVQHHTEFGSFWIVSFDGIYYAVPKSLWPLRPSDLLRSNKTILSSTSLTELVDRLSARKVPLLSIIIPTRGRPAILRRALDSIKVTTHDLESIEIILVTDEDDSTMIDFSYSGLPYQRVSVPPGLTMGELNIAGYDAATGDYIFLLNDDVIARTPGWDKLIAETLMAFPDGVVLVGVNDKIFQDTLCTFPLLSRGLCETMGGICPKEYVRYRIDDHIHNIFNLLALLGHRRIVYMDEVVFEHLNRIATAEGSSAYLPNESIHARDTLFFDSRLPERKALAVRLAAHIDAFASQNLDTIRANKLLAVTDSVAIRDPRYVRRSQGSTTLSSDTTRVTIGVVSADMRSEHSRQCLEKLKQHTRNFDLIVLDNNRGPNFNHAREMNRLLQIAKTEYLVLMDDDVLVEPGWLDEMLKAINPKVGMVTPGHKNLAGDFVYGGIVMRPDQSGHHTHIFCKSRRPRCVQTICSAIFLLDLTKCGHLRVDEQYTKYFLDIEFGLKVWEAGFQVVCTTSIVVTHMGGATLKQGSELSSTLYEEQRRKFIRAWIDTGRYWKLESVVWPHLSELRPLVQHPGLVGRLLDAAARETPAKFESEIDSYCARYGAYPALLEFMENAAGEALRSTAGTEDSRHNLKRLIETSQKRRSQNPDVSTVRSADDSRAPWQPPIEEIPVGEDGAEVGRIHHANGASHSEVEFVPAYESMDRWQTTAETAVVVKQYLGRAILRKGDLIAALPASSSDVNAVPEYVGGSIEGIERWVSANTPDRALRKHRGYVVSRFDHKYFAISENDGEFSYSNFKRNAYTRPVVGHSLPEVLMGIDRMLDQSNDSSDLPPLVFLPSEALSSVGVLESVVGRSAAYLVGSGDAAGLNGRRVIDAGAPTLNEWAARLVQSQEALRKDLGPGKFSEVILPWTYERGMKTNLLETVAAKIANRVRVIHQSGTARVYDGENLHRLIYNKAYLASMMEHVPSLETLNVLEVGCSDGLVCDLMVLMGAKSVVGVDVMPSAGCSFPHERIEYRAENAARMSFTDGRFDLCLSIATFEHVPDPSSVLQEMLRVTRVGGLCYVQAGPLYHSPFGHHMFSYFGDYPWIHLRRSKEEIIDYVRGKGIADDIERDLATSPEQYISAMLNRDHINGLFLEQYRLDEFRRRKDVEILKFNISYEGRDLLTSQILAETSHLRPETLVEHGFEILFRRLS
jgi:GT2 family glycosyltransferase/SAM-dependent methyltransferase